MGVIRRRGNSRSWLRIAVLAAVCAVLLLSWFGGTGKSGPPGIDVRDVWICYPMRAAVLVTEAWRGLSGRLLDRPLLDLTPFGYEYLPGAGKAKRPPEARWLEDGKAGTVAGILWEEHRPIRRVEVDFAGPPPDAGHLALEAATNTPRGLESDRPTWWTRKYEPFPGGMTARPGSRTVAFEVEFSEVARRLRRFPPGFTHYPDPAGLVLHPPGFRHYPDPAGIILADRLRLRYTGTGKCPRVTALRAYGTARASPLRVRIEWGWRQDAPHRPFDGSITVYNGSLTKVRPLGGDGGVTMTGPSSWRSAGSASGRKGVEAEIRCVSGDARTVRFGRSASFPTGAGGWARFRPDRTVVTVRTTGGTFSFAPRDLEDGEPLLVPESGFFVAQKGDRRTPGGYEEKLGKRGTRTVRRAVRDAEEADLGRALDAHYTAKRPPIPRINRFPPPMRIMIPDSDADAAWKLAFLHVRRRLLDRDGEYLFLVWPYSCLLGQESWRIFQVMDLFGEHDIAAAGFKPWLRSQGRFTPAGAVGGGKGALYVGGWDLVHGQGHGTMLYALALHGLLTGDRGWLEGHRENLVGACDWVIRQRAAWKARAGEGTWSAGLMPPCPMGDYADWRSAFQTNALFWRGLRMAAEAVSLVDPDAGGRYRGEAEAFRHDIIRAAELSMERSPVVRVLDGTARRVIPPYPYLRGLASDIANPFSGGHGGPLAMDSDCGAAALGLGVLDAADGRLDETLDVLEDRLYLGNWMVERHARTRGRGRAAARAAFGGYYYQCGYSQSALVHLRRDDVPNFLRSTFNQYAASVDPKAFYQFREHPHRPGDRSGGDKTFEAAAFLERMRMMLVMEEGDTLWLARGTPRAWLEQGKKVVVSGAPTLFGPVSYELESGAEAGRITARVELPSRRPPKTVLLRLRHPRKAAIKSVTVNGRTWNDWDAGRELVRLAGLDGAISVVVAYH